MKHSGTDKYFHSIEGIQEVPLDPFFYTRLKGRMQNDEKATWQFSRWAVACLILTLILNITLLFNSMKEPVSTKPDAGEFASAYNLTTDSNY